MVNILMDVVPAVARGFLMQSSAYYGNYTFLNFWIMINMK